jgi:hypothetical protein
VNSQRSINWSHVAANTVVLVLLGVAALYFSTYAPKPFSEQELAVSRAHNLTRCGAGMFDVVPHAPQCPKFDAIALDVDCGLRDCEPFRLTLHADGRAVLEPPVPRPDVPRQRARISAGEYRELANLVASLQLDLHGDLPHRGPDAPSNRLRAGCDGNWLFEVDRGQRPGDVEAVNACLLDFKRRADWSNEAAEATAVDEAD